MHDTKSFDNLYDQIMSSYDSGDYQSEYSLESDSPVIQDTDIECIEDENSELYDIDMNIEDQDEDDKSSDMSFDNFEDLTDDDMLTEADDDPFADAPTEDTPPADDATPTEPTPSDVPAEDTAKPNEDDEPASEDELDSASYNTKMDLIISNISAALKTTINTAGSDLYDKILIYGFEESIKVFVEDYLKKMVDGDIKINTIEKMDIISFAAPNIDQIVKKIIQNLAKK